jgi:nicotinamide-nucleotide amidase
MLASPGEVRVFLVGRADSDEEARRLLEAPEAAVRERLGKYLFGDGEKTHAAVALEAVARAGWALATVEGYTGGLLAQQLRDEDRGAYAGGEVLPADALAALAVAEGEGAMTAEGAVARLAQAVARRRGATAGLSVALGSELREGADSETAWIGLWAAGRETARPFRLSGAGDLDRLRVVQQAFYELRTFAGAV